MCSEQNADRTSTLDIRAFSSLIQRLGDDHGDDVDDDCDDRGVHDHDHDDFDDKVVKDVLTTLFQSLV